MVLPSGEIIHVGAPVSKSSSGYSLLHLIIGSEGTLGIITELTLKLIAPPKCHVTLIVPFAELADGIGAVPSIKHSGLNPQTLEFFEKEILESSEEYMGKSVFPKEVEGQEVGAYLLVTLDSNDREQLDKQVEEAAEMMLEAGALDVLVADTPMFLEKTWAARSSFLEGIEEQYKLLDECDVVVPVSSIPDFVLYIKEIQGDFPFEVKMFGHAGDGNLHIYTCANDMELPAFKQAVDQFMHKLYAKCTELGGQISGEHGIGFGKVQYLAENLGNTSMALMQGIKEVFDPNLILNPNKVCF